MEPPGPMLHFRLQVEQHDVHCQSTHGTSLPALCDLQALNPKSQTLQVSLEMDDESEDEVEALSEMYDPDGSSDGTHRFMLLKELWASAR